MRNPPRKERESERGKNTQDEAELVGKECPIQVFTEIHQLSAQHGGSELATGDYRKQRLLRLRGPEVRAGAKATINVNLRVLD